MDYIKELGSLALASRMKKIVEKLNHDVKAIYNSENIDFEPLLMPIFKLLENSGELQITQISDNLGISQPASTQLCNLLKKKNLISINTCKEDQRRKKITFTKKGQERLKLLAPVWNEIQLAVDGMIHNSNDLLLAIEAFEENYESNSLKDRVIYELERKRIHRIEIVEFEDRLAPYFKKLNEEWILKYFTIEKSDVSMLENPRKNIIQKGGNVYFAKLENEVVGTYALIKYDEGLFEIGKMAVTESCQGQGIGKKLLEHAISTAHEMNLRKLILYSNTKLTTAVNMYIKKGFLLIPKDHYHNKRANIKMELILN